MQELWAENSELREKFAEIEQLQKSQPQIAADIRHQIEEWKVHEK